MEAIRFHSPYRRWITGLLAEIGVFIGFVLVVGLVAYFVWLVG